MQELKAEKPPESPEGSDPVARLMERLGEEGFTTEQGAEWWDEYGEIIYRRAEKLPLAAGETIFIFTRTPTSTSASCTDTDLWPEEIAAF